MTQSWIIALITASFSLVGVILGLFSNFIFGKKQFERQREWEIQKNEIEYRRKAKEQELNVYNRILQVDGEVQTILIHDITEFNAQEYKDKIRPILYENFHVIEKGIREMVIDIDNILKQWSTYENWDFADEKDVAQIYENLIRSITYQYHKDLV